MPRPDSRTERRLGAFAREVEEALGGELVCLVLHGSATGEEWVAGRSDLNTAIVVRRVTTEVLEALVALVGRWRRHGFAVPVVLDDEYLARARDMFPMELDDIRRQHRVLAGRDVFATLALDPVALRRECEQEAHGKLFRLRTLFLEAAATPRALERLMVESLKSFLVVLRHLLALRGVEPPFAYAAVLAAGEALLGTLPIMRRLLEHRAGLGRLDRRELRGEFAAYLGEIERIVTAVDALAPDA
jgi:hypothetical protein